jgi:hypothetical protein
VTAGYRQDGFAGRLPFAMTCVWSIFLRTLAIRLL